MHTLIDGVALGAVIAAACDVRVASETAKIAFLFVRVGLAGADMGACTLLPRLIGTARAARMMMLGERIGGEEAERIGLVYKCVEDADLAGEAMALAERALSERATA